MNFELEKQIDIAPRVNLGSVAKRVMRINDLHEYGLGDVRGVSNSKEIVPTKANVTERALERFYVVCPGEFVFNRRVHGTGARRLGLGFNCTARNFIFTEDYVAFSVDRAKLLPEFLFIFFRREDFNRYVVTNSWGSATEFFNWEDMCRVKIPLPPIEVQRAYVDAYKGLTALIEENEALLKSLEAAAQACMAECREKWPMVSLGDFIIEEKSKNSSGKLGVKELKGVTSQGAFEKTKAKTEGLDFKNYKILKKGMFAYNPSRINIGSIAILEESIAIVSPMYVVFKISEQKENLLLPEFLYLWFKRPEFQRSTLFYAVGSVRDTFNWEDMCRVKIPLPPIEVQRAIVALYHCAEEARKISQDAREQLKRACSAFIQRAARKHKQVNVGSLLASR